MNLQDDGWLYIGQSRCPIRGIVHRLYEYFTQTWHSLDQEYFVVFAHENGVAADGIERFLVGAVPKMVDYDGVKNAKVAGDAI